MPPNLSKTPQDGNFNQLDANVVIFHKILLQQRIFWISSHICSAAEISEKLTCSYIQMDPFLLSAAKRQRQRQRQRQRYTLEKYSYIKVEPFLVFSSDRSSYSDGDLLYIDLQGHFLKYQTFLPIYLVFLFEN